MALHSKFIYPKRVSMQISENAVVSIHYTLTNNAGQTIDSSVERGEPLAYLHGAGNIIPGLEKALLGKQAGDKLDVTVTPEEGYGERHEQLIQQVPKTAFEGNEDNLQPGMQFPAQTEAGAEGGDKVTVTLTICVATPWVFVARKVKVCVPTSAVGGT